MGFLKGSEFPEGQVPQVVWDQLAPLWSFDGRGEKRGGELLLGPDEDSLQVQV